MWSFIRIWEILLQFFFPGWQRVCRGVWLPRKGLHQVNYPTENYVGYKLKSWNMKEIIRILTVTLTPGTTMRYQWTSVSSRTSSCSWRTRRMAMTCSTVSTHRLASYKRPFVSSHGCYPCQVLNQYLNGLMDGLTAKVFRYKASIESTMNRKVVR